MQSGKWVPNTKIVRANWNWSAVKQTARDCVVFMSTDYYFSFDGPCKLTLILWSFRYFRNPFKIFSQGIVRRNHALTSIYFTLEDFMALQTSPTEMLKSVFGLFHRLCAIGKLICLGLNCCWFHSINIHVNHFAAKSVSSLYLNTSAQFTLTKYLMAICRLQMVWHWNSFGATSDLLKISIRD